MITNGNKNNRFMSEINVTPFVDVMLVLLIIFMVTAPMMMQGVEVNLPKTAAQRVKTPEDPLILTVNKQGEVYIEKHRLDLKDLETKIEKILKYRHEKQVLLRADKEVPYGFVIDVVARVKKAGIDKLGMITEPLDEQL